MNGYKTPNPEHPHSSKRCVWLLSLKEAVAQSGCLGQLIRTHVKIGAFALTILEHRIYLPLVSKSAP